MAIEITTISELRKAIRKHPCYIQPRFGVSEEWIAISKKTALGLIEGIAEDSTPEQAEMYTGCFGIIEDDGTLSLG